MQFTKTWTPAALDAAGLADDIAYVAPGYVLTANDAGDSLAHIITILGNAGTNHSGKTFTITGTDADGQAQTQGIAGPNGIATVSSTKYFKTVTSVTVSATTGADTFDIGWTGVSVGTSIGLEKFSIATAACSLDVTGTCNFTLQQTPEDFYNTPQQNGIWSTAIAAGAVDVTGSSTQSMRCLRVLVNSVTATATLRISVAQAISP